MAGTSGPEDWPIFFSYTHTLTRRCLALKADLIESLVEKYEITAPSKESGEGRTYLFKSFLDGAAIPSDDPRTVACAGSRVREGVAGNNNRQTYSENRDYYRYDANRSAPADSANDCDASILITLREVVGFPDQIAHMQMVVSDRLAQYEDAKTVDEAHDTLHEAYLSAAPAETTKPEL